MLYIYIIITVSNILSVDTQRYDIVYIFLTLNNFKYIPNIFLTLFLTYFLRLKIENIVFLYF